MEIKSPTLFVSNTSRGGICVMDNGNYPLVCEVLKKAGQSVYDITVEGRFIGVTRVYPHEAFEVVADYLGATIVVDAVLLKKGKYKEIIDEYKNSK